MKNWFLELRNYLCSNLRVLRENKISSTLKSVVFYVKNNQVCITTNLKFKYIIRCFLNIERIKKKITSKYDKIILSILTLENCLLKKLKI